MSVRWYSKLFPWLMLISLIIPTAVGAAGALGTKSQSNVSQFLKLSGYSDTGTPESPITLIGAGINMFLSLFGMIFLVLTIYAGVKWMTAGGNTEQIDEAKGILRNAVIGLAIVLLAYVITYTVITWLSRGSGFKMNANVTNI